MVLQSMRNLQIADPESNLHVHVFSVYVAREWELDCDLLKIDVWGGKTRFWNFGEVSSKAAGGHTAHHSNGSGRPSRQLHAF